MAEAANALPFIESNFEELNPEEQLDKVRKEIRDFGVKLKLQELNELSKLADLDVLILVRDVLENGDNKFLEWLDDEYEFFISFVKDELVERDVIGLKWENVILHLEWKWRMVKHIQENFENTQLNFFKKMTVDFPIQFDEGLIKKMTQDFQADEEVFGQLVQEEDYRARNSDEMSMRLQELFDHQLEAKMVLHNGFKKNCGPKGQKLTDS